MRTKPGNGPEVYAQRQTRWILVFTVLGTAIWVGAAIIAVSTLGPLLLGA